MILDPTLDPTKLHDLHRAWAEQEHWFQTDRSAPDSYSFPVPGSREVAHEGEEAYYLYRDAFVPLFAALDGDAEVHEQIYAIYTAVAGRDPAQSRKLAEECFPVDDRFVHQWGNLFVGVSWPGLTHETLALYVRKYEVEWPLRALACLVDLLATGDFDATLAVHRDRHGRLLKGRIITHLGQSLHKFPVLQEAVATGYSAPLRNAIGHNDYTIENDSVCASDESFRETSTQVFQRVKALQTLHNGILWLRNSLTRAGVSNLASKGIVAVGWHSHQDGHLPRASLAQLAPFHNLDRDANWLTSAAVWFKEGKMMTRFGAGRARGGPMFPPLWLVLEALRLSGRMQVELFPVMPCLHHDALAHATFVTDRGTYCPVAAPIAREVLVTECPQ